VVYVDECDEYISTDSLLYSAKKPFELAKERGRDDLVELLQSAINMRLSSESTEHEKRRFAGSPDSQTTKRRRLGP